MDAAVLESVSKVFHHRPAFFNWIGNEQRGETRALHEISLRVPKGKILALLGPNGSGKTTILKLIATVLLPDSGHVQVEGSDTRLAPGRVRGHVGFAVAAERSFFPRLSARENLDFFAALENVPRPSRSREVERVLACVGLLEEADLLVMKFSGGMYQRLGMARALIKKPSLMKSGPRLGRALLGSGSWAAGPGLDGYPGDAQFSGSRHSGRPNRGIEPWHAGRVASVSRKSRGVAFVLLPSDRRVGPSHGACFWR
ncbi:MAG: hypothetical protein DMG68_03475 [Acidobacteria bacterium]|nr:MAG: hypothetical protein DMG68_03475 [Acidobacteriota bacterium]